MARDWGAQCAEWSRRLSGCLHHRAREADSVLSPGGCGLSGRTADLCRARQLVDPPPRRGGSGTGGSVADRTGLAADLCALAEPDREVVALAAGAGADHASAGRRLGWV